MLDISMSWTSSFGSVGFAQVAASVSGGAFIAVSMEDHIDIHERLLLFYEQVMKGSGQLKSFKKRAER